MAAAGVAGREVGQPVGAADGLDVVHVALAAKVAGGSQVDLERVVTLVAAIEVVTMFSYLFGINRHSIILRSFISCCLSLALKTLLPISRNRMDQITFNKQLGNHLNHLNFSGCFNS